MMRNSECHYLFPPAPLCPIHGTPQIGSTSSKNEDSERNKQDHHVGSTNRWGLTMTLTKLMRTYQPQTVQYQGIFHVFRFLLLAFTSNFSPFCSPFQFVMHVKSFMFQPLLQMRWKVITPMCSSVNILWTYGPAVHAFDCSTIASPCTHHHRSFAVIHGFCIPSSEHCRSHVCWSGTG